MRSKVVFVLTKYIVLKALNIKKKRSSGNKNGFPEALAI